MFAAAGTLLFFLLWSPWVRLSATEEIAGSEIVVGVSNVQSGPSGALGKGLLYGSSTYFDLMNKQGGIHGRTIKIILKDDQYEPDPAVRNTQELITKDRVFFLFAYAGTPTLTRVLPLLKYYEAGNIVNVAPFTGAEPQRRPPYDRFVFNIRASYRDETDALVRYLYDRGFRRIGFLGQADAYGKSGEVAVTQALAELHLKPVAVVSYRRNQPLSSDMNAHVQLLRKAGADAVIVVGIYGPCAAFIRDARLAGWALRWRTSALWKRANYSASSASCQKRPAGT